MTWPNADIVVIGGSSGSIPVLIKLLDAIPAGFSIPVIIVVHRLKNVESDLKAILGSRYTITEPEDKEPVMNGHIYLAPQNYHLLIEEDHTFSLDYSELVNFSRPSIDVTFAGVADIYKERAIAIVLSGSNKDGAEGLQAVIAAGGLGVVQDPLSAEYTIMPEAAIAMNTAAMVLTPSNIITNIFSIPGNRQTM